MTTAAGEPREARVKDFVAMAWATWFGCGLIPKAPGTWGSIGAVPLYLLVAGHGPLWVVGAALTIALLGVPAATRVAVRSGGHDPQIVCVDEVAGVLLTLAPAPRTWLGVIIGVALFRLLDVWKPWPARLCERKLPGGWGIVFDDVVAGAWGAIAILLARALGWR